MDRTAFVDESQSNAQADPNTYILAAAIVGFDSFDPVREQMRGLLIKRGGKLHWRDEPAKRQTTIMEVISALKLEHIVVVRSKPTPDRPERCRRLCLEQLCWQLEQLGVSEMVLESRGPADDKRDRDALDALRARKIVTAQLRMAHQVGRVEPLLWVPDAVCGAVVADRTGTPSYLEQISGSCTVVEL